MLRDVNGMIRPLVALAALCAAALPPAAAQEAPPADSATVAELERQIAVLFDEVEQLRSGEAVEMLTAEEARARGLSPSAAAVYGKQSGVSLAGYGEMLYENYAGDKTTQFDFLRANLYLGYRFNDRFLFNSEIEIEHADEVYVEFAFVDYLATANIGLRAGMLLVPMGLTNEFHEPNVYVGTERPVTERSIMPSTWRSNGGGIYGIYERFLFRAYVISGFNGSAFSASGLRGGRQKGRKELADNLALTGRFDFLPMPGAFVGGSIYTGGSGQGKVVVDGDGYDVRTTIIEVHGQVQRAGLDLRALYARATVEDADKLNMSLELEGNKSVGSQLSGAYVQAGYDVLARAARSDLVLMPYLRYEVVDTQAKVPSGFSRDPARNNTYVTAGVEFRPIPQVVCKVDYTAVTNDADSGVNQFNINIGYAF